jgi:hypothetical protein
MRVVKSNDVVSWTSIPVSSVSSQHAEVHNACEGANFSAIFVDARGIIPCLRLAWWSIAFAQARIG